VEAAKEKFEVVLTALTSLKLGNDWTLALTYLAEIKSRLFYGFGTRNETLKNKDRPQEIHTWIATHRRLDKPPIIKNIKAYADGLLRWWRTIQPEWRQEGDATLPSTTYTLPTGENWGRLPMPGPNGLVTVFHALSFWGSHPGVSSSELWCSVMSDVRRTMRAIAEFVGGDVQAGEDDTDDNHHDGATGSKRPSFAAKRPLPRKRGVKK
jgi:hypothetical protein